VWLDTLESAMLSRPDWHVDAACRDLPVDWFFPEQGPNAWHDLRQAVAVCQECPVIADCLNYALQFEARTLPGIWGGTSENQRRAMLISDTPIR
jgi:WhiB family transcriptional regulator, redox-sensing transcriptional regulator